jgi:hypothetical protein
VAAFYCDFTTLSPVGIRFHGVIRDPTELGFEPSLLGRVAVAVAKGAAETLLPLNRSSGFVLSGDDQLIIQALMISLSVIMGNVFVNGYPQRLFTEENHSLQTFFLDRPHEAFGEGI